VKISRFKSGIQPSRETAFRMAGELHIRITDREARARGCSRKTPNINETRVADKHAAAAAAAAAARFFARVRNRPARLADLAAAAGFARISTFAFPSPLPSLSHAAPPPPRSAGRGRLVKGTYAFAVPLPPPPSPGKHARERGARHVT